MGAPCRGECSGVCLIHSILRNSIYFLRTVLHHLVQVAIFQYIVQVAMHFTALLMNYSGGFPASWNAFNAVCIQSIHTSVQYNTHMCVL